MLGLTSDEMDRLATSLRAGEYNLLIGAGISLGSTGGDGKELPTGEGLRVQLCDLKGARANTSLQRVFELLADDEVEKLVTRRFSKTTPGPAICLVPTFPWRRIFTLNVDDAVEQAYDNTPALQKATTRNYKDVFQEDRELSSIPIIHLHGYAPRSKDGYIFSRTAYVDQVSRGSSWMAVLADLMAVEPFIVIGTALDEPDLEFYLARRNGASTRDDKGPGFFVEPFPDAVTRKDCEKHSLTLYEGTAEAFFEWLNDTVRDRVPPIELGLASSAGLFPDTINKVSLAKFFSDFEAVPGHVQENSHDPRFLLGHEPTWSDLESRLDVARKANTSVIGLITHTLDSATTTSPKLVYYSDEVGGGKSTTIRRIAFDLARSGYRVLTCSALGRIEPAFTASMIDLLEGPVIVIIDDFADQVGPIADVIDIIEKIDIVFLATERSYRARYLNKSLSGLEILEVPAFPLSTREARQLVDTYTAAGMVGNPAVAKQPDIFAARLKGEPIAVACCRILNDFKPMDRIVESLLSESNKVDKDRYLSAALGQFCINGGIRYDLLVAVSGAVGLKRQLEPFVSLPLTFSEYTYKTYIVPLNSVIGSRVLESCAKQEPGLILDIFKRMGRSLAARVNRETIKRRTPEARLAGRLFDFDQVAEHFLGERSEEFYNDVQGEWQWNSRYWEQVALLNLGKFYKLGDAGIHFLEAASQHARHAVAVEHHPFPLTTLGKVLLAQYGSERIRRRTTFDEALSRLDQAIELEQRWNWNSTQAYMITLKGVLEAVNEGVSLSSKQAENVMAYMRFAKRRFWRDKDLQEARTALESALGT